MITMKHPRNLIFKTNIKKIGEKSGFNIFTWDWNDLAETIGLKGQSRGVMADEVNMVNPNAITFERGFMKVN